jgi:hypothetical protein
MVGVVSNQIRVTKPGETTIDVTKLLDKPFYKYKHLRRLYAWICVVLMVQATNGLDGSIMNGLQTLPYVSVDRKIVIINPRLIIVSGKNILDIPPVTSLVSSTELKVLVVHSQLSGCGGKYL